MDQRKTRSESPALAGAVLDALDMGVCLLDGQGQVVLMNRWLRRFADGQGCQFMALLAAAESGAGQDLRLDAGAGAAMIVSAHLVDLDFDHARGRLLVVEDVTRCREAERRCRETSHYIAVLSDTAIEQALALKRHAAELEVRVAERTRDLHRANRDAEWMLAVASEARDNDTGRHVRRVQHYAELLARRLTLPAKEVSGVGHAAVLHDVGKIQVPDQVLLKPGPLTPRERRLMQKHTVIGQRILSRNRYFDLASHIARSHHENWDGSGYPDGLRSAAIPLAARLVHVADVYDALTSVRPYKPAWPQDRAAAAIVAGRGAVFDPEVVDAFVDLDSHGQWNYPQPRRAPMTQTRNRRGFSARSSGFQTPTPGRGRASPEPQA